MGGAVDAGSLEGGMGDGLQLDDGLSESFATDIQAQFLAHGRLAHGVLKERAAQAAPAGGLKQEGDGLSGLDPAMLVIGLGF
jgi:hypothetical protein